MEIVAICVAAIALFMVSACSSANDELAKHSYITVAPLSEDLLEYIADGAFGFPLHIALLGRGTINPTFDPDNLEAYEPFYGNHLLERSGDELEAIIANISDEERQFILKLFLNYKEATFRLLGEEDYVTEFRFSVVGGYEITIPFTLDFAFPQVDYTYRLTAMIFAEPNMHAMGDDNELWRSGFAGAMNFDLSLGNGGNINLSPTYNHLPLERSYNIGFIPLHITTESLPTIDSAWDLDLELENQPVIQASPGEVIEFSYLASPLHMTWGGEGERPPELIVESYLILALLDWQSIALSGYPYLFVAVEEIEYERITDLGRFTIVAPGEPSFYDFIAILIPNAAHRNNDYLYRPLVRSMRFTIEVVD